MVRKRKGIREWCWERREGKVGDGEEKQKTGGERRIQKGENIREAAPIHISGYATETTSVIWWLECQT